MSETQLQDAFTGHLDYLLGRTEDDHPGVERFESEGTFFSIERDEGEG